MVSMGMQKGSRGRGGSGVLKIAIQTEVSNSVERISESVWPAVLSCLDGSSVHHPQNKLGRRVGWYGDPSRASTDDRRSEMRNFRP